MTDPVANPFSPPGSPLNQLPAYRYNSMDGFVSWFKNLLLSRAILTFLLLVLTFVVGKHYPQLYGTGVAPSAVERVFNAFYFTLRLLGTLVTVSTIALFPVWLYLTTRNTWALGAKNLRFTPWWTVLWLLIPGMNLFKPYQGVREAYQACDPSESATTWQNSQVTEFISLWWLSWLASWGAAYFAATRGKAQILSSVLSIVAVLLTIVVVTTMRDRQNQKAETSSVSV